MIRLASLLVCAVVAFTASAEEYWNQFRGPNGDGKSTATGLPLRWSETENVAWKVKLPGRAWSSPVVWGDQVWVTNAMLDGKKNFALCFDVKTGKLLHEITVFENPEPRKLFPANSYASPTPYIEEGRIYVHFGCYGTACLDTKSGEKLWERRDLPCNHWRQPASSPVVHGNTLVVAFDGYDLQYVVALDKRDGRTLWKQDRNIDYGTSNGDRMKAYSTAAIFEHDGRLQAVSPSAMETISYDLKSGEVLWRVRHGGMNAACRPIYKDGLVFISAGSGDKSLIAVRPDGSGDVTKTHVAWNTGKSTPKRPSQIIVGDLLFMISDRGVVSCLNAKTGDIHWQERVAGEHWASPIYAEGRIYFSSKDGRTSVIAAEKEFKLLAENKLDAGFWASPAVAGNSLILRTADALYRIGD